MYVLIISLIVLGFVSEQSQVRGDFINPLNYIRYERAVIQLGKLVSRAKCFAWAFAHAKEVSALIQNVMCGRENKCMCARVYA